MTMVSNSGNNSTSRKRRRPVTVTAGSVVCFLLLATNAATGGASSSTSTSTSTSSSTHARVLRGADYRRHRRASSTTINDGKRLFQQGVLRKDHKNKDGSSSSSSKPEAGRVVTNNDNGYSYGATLAKCKKAKKTKAGKEEVTVTVSEVSRAGDIGVGEDSGNVEIVTETICDEYGQLLPGQTSYAPTAAPGENYNNGSEDNGQDNGDIIDSTATADTDNDNDGLTNAQESVLGTDPNAPDSDWDGLSDGQEAILGTDPMRPDTDEDGYDDAKEVSDGSDPLDASDPNNTDVLDGEGQKDPNVQDTDEDGLNDQDELEAGTDSNNPDSDGDGLTDGMEVSLGTNPLREDTDGDGLADYDEVLKHGTDPLREDTDGDGLNDSEVLDHGTSPLKEDTDGDGLSDSFEVENGLDPLKPSTAADAHLAVSPGCEAYANDEVYATAIPAGVNFLFEVALDSDHDIDPASAALEVTMARLVGRELIDCDASDRQRKRRRLRHRESGRRRLLVDGIDPSPPDIITQRTCTYYTSDNAATPPDSDCYVVQGLMTLYLREDTAQTSTLESSSRALKALLTAMNEDDPNPFLEDSGGAFGVPGVRAVRYVRGTPDEGGWTPIDNSGSNEVPVTGGNLDGNNDVSGAARGVEEEQEDRVDVLSPVGMALIGLGAAGIVGVALVAARGARRRRRPLEETASYAVFFEDDESELDAKYHGDEDDGYRNDGDAITAVTAIDTSTSRGTPSPTKSRNSEHHHRHYNDTDEEDSIFTGLGTYSPTGITPGHGSNVGEYVHSYHDDDKGSLANLTAEHGYECEFAKATSREYTPKVPLESPSYENPSDLMRHASPDSNGRGYFAHDTVEF